MNKTQTEAYKQAMDKVVPGAALNARVLEALRHEALRQQALGSGAQHRTNLQQRKSALRAFPVLHSPQWASIAAALILTTGLLMGGNIVYGTPVSWIDVDINPSVELGMNLFQRVVSVEAMNGDGDALMSGLELQGKQANSAVSELVREAAEMGYFPNKNEAVISLTVIDKRQQRSAALAASARQGTHAALAEAGLTAKVIEQVADMDQILQAETLKKTGHEVSPGKLLLIEKLAALDAEVNNSVSNNAKSSEFNATSWYGKSVREIQEKIDAHRVSLKKQQEQELALEVQKEIRKAERDALKEAKENKLEAAKAELEARQEAAKAELEAWQEAAKAELEAKKEVDKAELEAMKEADKAEMEDKKEADKAEQEALRDAEKAKLEEEKQTQGDSDNVPHNVTETEDKTENKPGVLPNGKTNPSLTETEDPKNVTKTEQITETLDNSADANAPEKSGTPGKSADTPAADKTDKADESDVLGEPDNTADKDTKDNK